MGREIQNNTVKADLGRRLAQILSPRTNFQGFQLTTFWGFEDLRSLVR
jgi:hypothetical protein